MGTNQGKFLALLRGINVGGKNLITKDQLQSTFEYLNLTKVRTYIQSGNILFRSGKKSTKILRQAIEKGLSARLNCTARAVVMSYDEYVSAIESAPSDWGRHALYKHDALFTLDGITPKDVLAQLPTPKKDIETISIGPGVLFWSTSVEHRTKTTFMKLPVAPIYQQLTIRNHKTVFSLLQLFDEI